MTDIIWEYLVALWDLTIEMAPYLLLGFLIAGILHVYISAQRMKQYMGKPSLKSVINAALIGIPLPLCSCGVIPTGMSFHKNGAANGPTVSFLISTPQTGVDSILATYSLLGLPMAIIRPIIAFVTGIVGGGLTNKITNLEVQENHDGEYEDNRARKGKLYRTFKYAFVDFLNDIAKWLVIGLLIAALIAVIVPDDFFTKTIGNEYLSMLLVLLASVPLYVCATGSVPIAAVLLMKGLSPGAAIVFLMAGPATNAATITVIGKVLGKKSLIGYMVSIIAGAILFGILVNEFLPREWFTGFLPEMAHDGHGDHFLPHWFKVVSGIAMIILLINGQIQKKLTHLRLKKQEKEKNTQINGIEIMAEKIVNVKGMTCNHCKANVERNVGQIEGIENVIVDLESGEVRISGDTVDLTKVKDTVESIGYEYEGEK
jgi:uncharacterized membrane protein YraQ (UPF0718 family)/copper chaperone CopZ